MDDLRTEIGVSVAKTRVLALFWALGWTALTGCEAAGNPGIHVDTLRGGRIFISNPGPTDMASEGLLRLEEELRIGRRNGGPEAEVFSAIGGIDVDSDGRIYVADFQAMEIRVFDPSGAHLHSFGREGEGPGEFSFISGIATHPSGTLWVMDPSNARLTEFTRSGEVVGTAPRRMGFFATIPWVGGFDSLGRLYDLERDSTREGGSGRMYVRYDVRDGSGLHPSDTLRLPPFEAQFYAYSQDGLQLSSIIPFSPFPLAALAPDGSIWLGNSGEYRFHRVGFRGDTLLTVELRVPPIPLSRRERDSAAVAGGLSAQQIPRVRPAVRFLTTDPTGQLWVRPELPPGETPAWDLFEEGGKYLGRVQASASFEMEEILPVAFEGGIIGVVRDELGVEYVVRARLEAGNE